VKIISLNIRGLEGVIKWRYIKGLISMDEVEISYIHETKCYTIRGSI